MNITLKEVQHNLKSNYKITGITVLNEETGETTVLDMNEVDNMCSQISVDKYVKALNLTPDTVNKLIKIRPYDYEQVLESIYNYSVIHDAEGFQSPTHFLNTAKKWGL